jgi:hypothetical protein
VGGRWEWSSFCVFCSGEEGGGGKILLWEKGAYKGLDVCLMYVLSFLSPLASPFTSDVLLNGDNQVSPCTWPVARCQSERLAGHRPAPSRLYWTHVRNHDRAPSSRLSLRNAPSSSSALSSAHAALSPWEGQNALDAAVLAYTNIGLLRQQIKPTHRVHGVFGGQDWAPNSL